MAFFQISGGKAVKINSTSYKAEGLHERQNLQRLLKDQIEVISDDLMVLSEEFGNWEDSRRRIDLLCLDRHANLVVVELKRTEDGGHMELQALRYAAMISKMTFSAAVEAHRQYLANQENTTDPEDAILSFLGWDESNENDFASDVRVLLVSAEFSKELTTTVLWLNERDLDIRCIRIKPYRLNEQLVIDVQQIVPLPEASVYQVSLREKVREERRARESERDTGRFELRIGGTVFSDLPKRRLAYHVIAEAIRRGAKPREVMDFDRSWIAVQGTLDEEKFLDAPVNARLEGSSTQKARRFYTNDGDLFHIDGKTYALTKMWGESTEGHIQRIIKIFKLADVEYTRISDRE